MSIFAAIIGIWCIGYGYFITQQDENEMQRDGCGNYMPMSNKMQHFMKIVFGVIFCIGMGFLFLWASIKM